MVARLAALGALDAEGTVHEDSLHLCCLCLIVRSQQESLSVVKAVWSRKLCWWFPEMEHRD